MKIPVGECIGEDIHVVTVAQLETACEKVEADLCSTRQNTHRARKLRAFVAAARPLLHRRKFPTGSYGITADANRALSDAAEVGHLLAPSDMVANVLEGTAIVISAFRVDIALDTFEDDEDKTKRVPGKSMLDRVARDLGIGWDARLCRRTDDQTQVYVRSCQVGGVLRNFDGSERPLQAQAEIDLTDGSALQRSILRRFADNTKGRIELGRRRQFILAHADTNARLRVIRQLGLRDHYTRSELEKPFFCAKVQFTGQATTPEGRTVMAERIADTFLPASNAAFGTPKKAAGE